MGEEDVPAPPDVAAGEEELPPAVDADDGTPLPLPGVNGVAMAPAPAAGRVVGELTGLVAVPSAAAMYAAAAADAASAGVDPPEATTQSCQAGL